MPRHARRKDSTQDGIAEAWTRHGFWVLDLHRAAATFSFMHNGQIEYGGIADLLALFGGHAVFIECKVPGGGQNDVERAFEDECILQHVPYVICSSTDEAIEEAKRWRSRILQGAKAGRT